MGIPIEDRYHSQNAADYIKALKKWLRSKTKPKSANDKRIARAIIKDLEDALKGK
jgi:hypothetical protein